MINESGTMTGGGGKPRGGRMCLGSAAPRPLDTREAAAALCQPLRRCASCTLSEEAVCLDNLHVRLQRIPACQARGKTGLKAAQIRETCLPASSAAVKSAVLHGLRLYSLQAHVLKA